MDEISLENQAVSWLGCPIGHGPIEQRPSSLYCPTHDLSFLNVNGILRLLSPGKVTEADAFAAEYRRQRQEQGWRPLSAEEMSALPYKSPSGWDPLDRKSVV